MATRQQSGIVGKTLGIAAVVAAAAGAYFLYGDKGARNRRKIKGWALKLKGEVLQRIENAKDVTEETYNKIIDDVSARYERIKTVDKAELQELVDDLKRHWSNIKYDVLGPVKKSSRRMINH